MVEYNLAAVQRFCIHPRKQSVRTRAYAAHPSQAYDMKQPSNDQSATPKATLLLSRPITMSLHCRLVGNACSRAREFFTTVTRYALRKNFVSASIPGTYLKNAKIASILDFHVIIRRTRRVNPSNSAPIRNFLLVVKPSIHDFHARKTSCLSLSAETRLSQTGHVLCQGESVTQVSERTKPALYRAVPHLYRETKDFCGDFPHHILQAIGPASFP